MTTAMTCPVGRPQSSIPCAPPIDPPGFIYPSYRAASAETLRDKPPLKSPHQGGAYVSSSIGGSVSTLSFEDTTIKNRLSSHRRCGGGIRDRVRGFSRTSRRNLLRRLASINRRAIRTFKGRMIFVTLTYPKQYPEDPELCKRHLKALRKRLQRITHRACRRPAGSPPRPATTEPNTGRKPGACQCAARRSRHKGEGHAIAAVIWML